MTRSESGQQTDDIVIHVRKVNYMAGFRWFSLVYMLDRFGIRWYTWLDFVGIHAVTLQNTLVYMAGFRWFSLVFMR